MYHITFNFQSKVTTSRMSDYIEVNTLSELIKQIETVYEDYKDNEYWSVTGFTVIHS